MKSPNFRLQKITGGCSSQNQKRTSMGRVIYSSVGCYCRLQSSLWRPPSEILAKQRLLAKGTSTPVCVPCNYANSNKLSSEGNSSWPVEGGKEGKWLPVDVVMCFAWNMISAPTASVFSSTHSLSCLIMVINSSRLGLGDSLFPTPVHTNLSVRLKELPFICPLFFR